MSALEEASLWRKCLELTDELEGSGGGGQSLSGAPRRSPTESWSGGDTPLVLKESARGFGTGACVMGCGSCGSCTRTRAHMRVHTHTRTHTYTF